MNNKVFISFSSKDKKLAEKIYSSLKRQDISCWISSKDIPAGADYQACIVEAIEQAELVVLIFSSNANSSNEIAKELSLSSKKIVIPVRIEDVMPAGAFQYQLSNRQFIDLYDDFEAGLDDLAQRINAALSGVHLPEANRPRGKSIRKKILSPLNLGIFVGFLVLSTAGWIGYGKFKSQEPNPQISKSTAIDVDKTSVSNKVVMQSMSTEDVKSNSVVTTSVSESAPVAASTTIAPKAIDVSEKVKGLVGMLKGSGGYARETALRSMSEAIPSNLNAYEIEALLNGTDGNRTNSIGFLADKVAPNQTGEGVVTILGDTEGYNREVAIKSLARAEKIKINLLPSEASLILKGTAGNRTNSIETLANKVAPNQTGEGVATILGDTEGYNREVALKSLSRAGAIKKGLGPEDVQLILKGMSSSQINALGILAPYIAK